MKVITTKGKSKDVVAGQGAKEKRKPVSFSGLTPLLRCCSELQIQWLLKHCRERYEDLHGKMNSWRGKMAKYERYYEGNYHDRKTEIDEVNDSSVKDIFHRQNDNLGMVAGFCDFHFAQAKDDILGTRPWMGASPEGKADAELADTITKHANWKLRYSDVEPALIDALKVSTWGGTAFVKASYLRVIEQVMAEMPVAIDVRTGKPVKNEAGISIVDPEQLLAMGYAEEHIRWDVEDRADTETVYANVTNGLVDYKDICFETTAPELSLLYTDVFCRFKMGLLDCMERFNIPIEKKTELLSAIHGIDESARDHRDESSVISQNHEENSNPMVMLVEGFVRCAVKDGKTARIHVIFSPDLSILFTADYLRNVTPAGVLPIFPVRIERIPGRVFGRGYYEKFEDQEKALDRQYNLITHRNRYYGQVFTGLQTDALADQAESEDYELDPEVPAKLAPDKTISDLVQFTQAPDTNKRSENLLNSILQMNQMRSGITSAAQGELKGVPSSSTATGTRDLQSRGATIIKSTIDEQIADITKIIEYDVTLIYANLDQDETFAWGEGRETVLMTVKAKDARGLKANVTLSMTQSQNLKKMESVNAAIGIVGQWLQVPEVEKPAVRYMYVQALQLMGFHNAEDIIRVAAVDAAGIAALLPPDVAPIVMQALAQAGIAMPPSTSTTQTPP